MCNKRLSVLLVVGERLSSLLLVVLDVCDMVLVVDSD